MREARTFSISDDPDAVVLLTEGNLVVDRPIDCVVCDLLRNKMAPIAPSYRAPVCLS